MNTRLLGAAAALLFASACLSVDPPLPVRTFHPGPLDLAPIETGALHGLRLDRVSASPILGERMVWHLSDVELAFDELSRWSAPPADLVADAVRATLFESGFIARNELASQELTVRVTAFGGDLTGAAPRAHVRLVAAIRSRDTGATQSATLEASAPLAARDAAALARGIGQALSATMTQLRAWCAERGGGSNVE